MSRRTWAQRFSGLDEEVLALGSHQQRLVRDVPGTKDGTIQTWPSLAGVVYECTPVPDLVVTTISPNAFQLVGIQPENIIGKRLLSEDRVSPQDYDRLLARIDQSASAEMAAVVHRISDDQGLPVWVAHTLRKVRSGADAAVVGYMVPVLSEFFTAALDASIISQFVHQIGNHFQLINLLIGSMKRVGANAEEAVEALQQTVDRAVEFTRSFSQFSHPSVYATPIDVGEILSSAIKSAAPACADKEVVFQNVKTALPLDGRLVRGDAFLLELAFGAIIRNSLEATTSRNRILVSVGTEGGGTTEPAIARVVVADTGCGIEGHMLGKVAEPFVTSKRDRDGLGLSTAVRIIELHGGTLKIRSVLGQGTTVEIVLPTTRGAQTARK